jgi:hypothetical protein
MFINSFAVANIVRDINYAITDCYSFQYAYTNTVSPQLANRWQASWFQGSELSETPMSVMTSRSLRLSCFLLPREGEEGFILITTEQIA